MSHVSRVRNIDRLRRAPKRKRSEEYTGRDFRVPRSGRGMRGIASNAADSDRTRTVVGRVLLFKTPRSCSRCTATVFIAPKRHQTLQRVVTIQVMKTRARHCFSRQTIPPTRRRRSNNNTTHTSYSLL